MSRAVSQDMLVLFRSQPFPVSLASFGLISPRQSPRVKPLPHLYHLTMQSTLQIGHWLC